MPGKPAVIDHSRLPSQYPTTLHPPAFWEQLGRTVATFGFLEDVLGKAIFAFSATAVYSEEEVHRALGKWDEQLARALTDTLYPLAEVYGKVVRNHQDADFKNVVDLVDDIKKASKVRNALCHGSWHASDASGKTVLYYFDKTDGKFETQIDIAWMQQVQAHVVDLICDVVNSVTVLGWQFPGGAGPGEEIWP